MTTRRILTVLTASSLSTILACTAETETDPLDDPLLSAAVEDRISLEESLSLVPQVIDVLGLNEDDNVIDGSFARYVILDVDAGEFELDVLDVLDVEGDRVGLRDLFPDAPPVDRGVLERNALLLLSVPESDTQELCDRFHFAHDEGDITRASNQSLLFVSPTDDGLAHALCLMPAHLGGDDQEAGGISGLAAETDAQAYGSGTYTVRIKELECNDPNDWENWPGNGDEARLRGFHDGAGGAQLWSRDNVKSGTGSEPERFIHFNADAKVELYDHDSGFWNANDKLGQEWIYSGEACSGNHSADFDGNNYDYDMIYKVYGPECPCQDDTEISASYNIVEYETCSTLQQTITHYTYYCSGGIERRQAWGDVIRNCKTYDRTYDVSCEMNTFVSEQLTEDCDHYQYGVPIGSPVSMGSCAPPCGEPGMEWAVDAPSYEDQLSLERGLDQVLPVIEPDCPY